MTGNQPHPSASRSEAAGNPTRRWRARWISVAATVSAAVIVWAIARVAVGHVLTVALGSGPTQTVGLPAVVVASLVAAMLGLGGLAGLERLTTGARPIWTALAILVLLLSLAAPLSAHAATSTKIWLLLLHLTVGAVLIPTLARTGPTR